MPFISIKGLPKVRVAHVFSAERYSNILPEIKNCIEITYVSQGSLFHNNVDADVELEKYDISCNLFKKTMKVFSKEFHEHHTVSFYMDFDFCSRDADDGVFLPHTIKGVGYGKVHRLIDEIINIHTVYPEQTTRINGLFLQLVGEYDCLAREPRGNSNDKTSLYVKKAKKFIHENLNTAITQRDIAKYLGITPEYLCYVFKSSGEVSPIAFINHVKLTRIHAIMKYENMKLYKAAELYGYNDPNYVSRLYKKYYGRNITDFSDEV